MALRSPLRVLSLCSGIGGLDLALKLALGPRGARTVAYVERESYAAAILVARMEDSALDHAPVWDDLATFDGRPWRGAVDCVVAGFPCQPWSNAGARRGVEDERWLWPLIAEIVRQVAPPIVFLENVPGLVSGGGLGEVLGSLAELGYDAEWMVLGAEDVGAPHRRDRVFILAHSDGGGRDRLHERYEPGHLEADTSGGRSRDETSEVGFPYSDGRPGLGLRSPCLTGFNAEAPGPEPIGDGGGSMADTGRRCIDPHQSVGLRWRGVEATSREEGKELADGDRAGRAGERGDAGSEQPTPQRDSGEPVADPQSQREGRLPSGRGRPQRVSTSNIDRKGEVADWPPGPEDRDGWDAVLAEHPELAPALPSVRRMVDGTPNRMDRLRALGNGVVPAQGALAFRILWGRLE